MLKTILLAAVVAAASARPAARLDPPARLVPVTNGSCVTMAAAPHGRGFVLKNKCSVCRTALVSWCDGEAHMFKVRGGGAMRIDACRGFQTLLSDAPCER